MSCSENPERARYPRRPAPAPVSYTHLEHLLGEVVAVAMIALGVSRFGAARADVLDRRARGLEDGLAMPAEAQQSLALGLSLIHI